VLAEADATLVECLVHSQGKLGVLLNRLCSSRFDPLIRFTGSEPCQFRTHARRKRGLHSNTLSARLSSGDGMVSASNIGGLEIDDQLVIGRRLRREIGRLLAF
jgi:hypothetical protein